MNILALDTSFAACSVAIARDDAGALPHVVGLFEPMQTGHAERLVPMLSEVVALAHIEFSDLDLIAVTNGPGSFTGTRIAVSAARALALALPRARLVAASSLAVMAVAAARRLAALGFAAAENNFSDLVITIDARRGEVYAQHFAWSDAAASVTARTEPELLTIEAAAWRGGMRLVHYCGSGAAQVAERAASLGREPAAHFPELLPDARDLATLARWLEPACGPVKPLYLRPADAKPQTGKSIERAHP